MSSIFLHQTPSLLQAAFPKFSWKKSPVKKIIHLTFDDGPVLEATPLVLHYLREFDARATFFCVGENIIKYPEVFHQVLKEGHSVGNHTYHHLNGWRTSNHTFLNDVAKCQELLNPHLGVETKPLMRPPYGRIKRKQWRALIKEYDVVMWDVLSGDFSEKIDTAICLKKTIKYTQNGSIVLFHDSLKTIHKLRVILPEFLEHFSQLGFSFQGL